MSNYKLSNEVVARIAQILQESLLNQSDAVDSLLLMELEVDPRDQSKVTLTEDYMKRVEEYYSNLERMALDLKVGSSGKIVGTG